jgi:hypothetical protein
MQLDIFFDNGYFNKLEEFISIEKITPIYPFLDMRIDPDNLVADGYNLTEIYHFLKNVCFFYFYNQSHYGYVKINDDYYIIEVGDEVNIVILGDNEINWTKLLLDDYDYLLFKDFCLKNYDIEYKESDYDKYLEIKTKYMRFD